MIKYFKELLNTLKKIEQHLAKLSGCVKTHHHGYGDKQSISTVDWNS